MENLAQNIISNKLAPKYSTTFSEPIVILIDQQFIVNEVNQSAIKEFFGKTKKEILGQFFVELLVKQNIETKEIMAGIKYSEHSFFYASKLYQPNTKKNYDLSIICIQIKHENHYVITLKACNNESYNNLKAYITAIINNLPGAVYWKDREGHYVGCNKFVAKMAGFDFPEEMIGKTDYDLCWKEFADDWQKLDREVLNQGETIVREEKIKLANGDILTELTYKSPLKNEYNEIIGIIGTSLDISHRKQAEKDLKKAKELAESANHAKTEFLSNMQHDLRTPFTGILGLAEVMELDEKDPKKKKNLSYITQSAKALLDHVNEIFEFVEVENGQLPILEKQFNLHTLLNNVSNVLLPPAKNKGLNFTLAIANDVPQFLFGDAVRIQRILMNLISNAIKFTQRGGVAVKVEVIDQSEGKIVVGFIIEDTGVGIPEDKQNIIFERFNRLTSSYSGVYPGKGLGLRIVRQFLEEIGGQSHLESKLGEGTTFRILIPYKVSLLTCQAKYHQGDLVDNYADTI